MPLKKSVVRRLTLTVIAIVALVIAATGLVTNSIGQHYALESAREVLRFNSASLLNGIDRLMLSHNNEGVSELIQDMSEGSAVYRDIRLVSHYSGEVVVSRLRDPGEIMSEADRSCAICHDLSDPLIPFGVPIDEVVDVPGGGRVLHVVTPIRNEPSCSEAACHVHRESGPILGFLEAEYSLARIDALLFGINTSFVVAAVVAILLGAIALLIMFERSLNKPIRYMISGIRALAGNDLSFRFRTDREDEFGQVEESFDQMATRIELQSKELRSAREYLEAIVENSADFIITVNPHGIIQTINRGAEEGLGYRREELIGRPIDILFADPHEREIAIARLDDQPSVSNYETRFLTKDKEIRHVLLTLSRLRDREGNPIGTMGISKDITNERDLKNLLLQAEAAAAIGQAVTAIQHGIKNMLNTLTGGSYLVRRGVTKDDKKRVQEGIAMIDDGIATIGDLSVNMLRYAKTWSLECETIDIGQLVVEICKAIEPNAAEKMVKLEFDIADGPTLASCDARLTRMALMDIATNALDACHWKSYGDEETAKIEFGVHRSENGRSIVIEIRDNGMGMTDEIVANIFTPFFSTKEKFGTGLGLALTSRIVRLHGGRIDVESEPEKGSLFRITLPALGEGTNEGASDG